jgi:hypothetical protein
MLHLHSAGTKAKLSIYLSIYKFVNCPARKQEGYVFES